MLYFQTATQSALASGSNATLVVNLPAGRSFPTGGVVVVSIQESNPASGPVVADYVLNSLTQMTILARNVGAATSNTWLANILILGDAQGQELGI